MAKPTQPTSSLQTVGELKAQAEEYLALLEKNKAKGNIISMPGRPNIHIDHDEKWLRKMLAEIDRKKLKDTDKFDHDDPNLMRSEFTKFNDNRMSINIDAMKKLDVPLWKKVGSRVLGLITMPFAIAIVGAVGAVAGAISGAVRGFREGTKESSGWQGLLKGIAYGIAGAIAGSVVGTGLGVGLAATSAVGYGNADFGAKAIYGVTAAAVGFANNKMVTHDETEFSLLQSLKTESAAFLSGEFKSDASLAIREIAESTQQEQDKVDAEQARKNAEEYAAYAADLQSNNPKHNIVPSREMLTKYKAEYQNNSPVSSAPNQAKVKADKPSDDKPSERKGPGH